MICKTQKLNNGKEIPTVGLGTWGMEDEAVLEGAIRNALSLGYRHIDTAFIYGNEKMIGNILKKLFDEGVVQRKDLFITSKLWNTFHGCPEDGLRRSLNDLQMDYVDLYLIHWPVTFDPAPDGTVESCGKKYNVGKFDAVGVWKKMEALVDLGLAKSIGISNFGKANTEKILGTCRICPAAIQIELHPYLNQKELVEFMKSKGIQVISYSSLGSAPGSSAKVRDDKTIKAIAKKYGCAPSQIILSYITAQGICVIPKSRSKEHLRENIDLKELSREDISAIDALNTGHRYVDPPGFGPEKFK
ncbi:ALDOSE REDUCTASE [Encephalitozoon cuniculi GB-M1]|uniref:Aldose reductase n=1 Tax=Encephalitozoon cuniculi (strain GB-M1) TaxID=284813 RepID=ALDR_ENCCU|nr:aldose reductase [Encephalitozoon cuniculi GB-M1]Q8SSK6.1 RecName: Full=Aldose reductase; Short=AR; AltName: Full=Aldehyde reductase [Encephalitozoon cuniculi GB-M1]CAD24968.1 ALDOSE REDUCTASE [Encephalitozoon cuniculi GB-M1]